MVYLWLRVLSAPPYFNAPAARPLRRYGACPLWGQFSPADGQLLPDVKGVGEEKGDEYEEGEREKKGEEGAETGKTGRGRGPLRREQKGIGKTRKIGEIFKLLGTRLRA